MNVLPRLTSVGSCVLCVFSNFPAVRLFVREMGPNHLTGFDLTGGSSMTLTVTDDGQVINQYHWPAAEVRLLSETEVRLFLKDRPGELSLKAAELQREATTLSLIAERYQKEVPEILRHLKAPRPAAVA